MGIDFLDIHFRLERQFKIKIGNELVWVAESRGIKDLRVRYIVPVFGNCPECGTVASHYGQIQARVYQTLVAALGVQPEEIHLDALLIRDLGMG
jgi:acyl carrier protein